MARQYLDDDDLYENYWQFADLPESSDSWPTDLIVIGICWTIYIAFLFAIGTAQDWIVWFLRSVL